MIIDMKVRVFILLVLISIAGCMKETYDMDKLSKEAHLNPSFVISALKGEVSLNDIVEPNDTIVFDENNFIKVVFKKDPVIDLKLADFYDLDDMVSFSQSYTLGELSLAPFSGTIAFPINQISSKFAPPVTYSNGTYPGFPSFPAINIGEKSFTAFSNFENATFSEGTIEISVKNNLPVTMGGLTIKLYNAALHTQIGNDIVISSVSKGSTGIGNLDLKDLTITNSISVAVTLHATTGTSNPVQINLNTTNIEISISGKNMKVKSGRIVVPVQTISSLDNYDTIAFDPGNGVKIDVIKIIRGNLAYTVKGLPLKITISLTLPSAFRGTDTLKVPITVNPNLTIRDTYSLNNTMFYLGDIASQPYNMVVVKYSIEASSDGSLINFKSTDGVTLDLRLSDPQFDYVKGNFGQRTETIEDNTLDLGIKDILNHISGTFHIASPSIKFNYTNSFAIPLEIDLMATGYRQNEKVDLKVDTILNYPATPAEHVKSGLVVLDKSNSALPALISLPPEKVRFSGSAIMNPANTTSMDNYVFGNSAFFGSVDVEVPLEFSLTNLQFKDTVDNFLSDMNQDTTDAPLSPDDIEYLRIDFTALNEFPVGISLNMILLDSASGSKIDSVNANEILKPALVKPDGRLTEAVESTTNIEITDDFWKSVNKADKIILRFGAVTSDNTSKDVKIYSDYKINYKAALVVRADYKFSFK